MTWIILPITQINFQNITMFKECRRCEVSNMVQQSYGLESIKSEVANCRVLCANHHQKHTTQQFGYKKWRPME